jgi:hypothetical protein
MKDVLATLQYRRTIHFFTFFDGFFAHLDPDPADQITARIHACPDPQHFVNISYWQLGVDYH